MMNIPSTLNEIKKYYPDEASVYVVDKVSNDHSRPALIQFKLLSSMDLYNAEPMRWLLHGVLPIEGLAAIYGASGSGKSFLVLDLACLVAEGASSWFGRRLTQSKVTYVCLEGEAGMSKRVKAWHDYHKKPKAESLKFVTQPFDLLNHVDSLAEAVINIQGKGGLLIIDTLNRASPGTDENSSKDMGQLINAARHLQMLIGGLVLLVHHTGKDQTKGMRGHSSLYAALDGAIEVVKTSSGREWSVAKSKDDVTGKSYAFDLEIVSLGNDQYGEPVTSCVVTQNTNISNLTRKGKPKLSEPQQIALNALILIFEESDVFPADIPRGKAGINYDDAVKAVAERQPADPKHRTTRAKEAIKGLIAKQYLGLFGDWLWLEE